MARRSNSPSAPLSWFAIVAISGLALVAVVVLDLRRTVDTQAEQVRAQAQRDAERVAAELRGRLLDSTTVELVPAHARIWIEDGAMTSRPPVVAEPEPPFDLDRRLDALAHERVRRAGRSDGEAALSELAPLLEDAAIPADARAWIRDRMAWTAHRAGLVERRDGLLAGCDDSASSLLLRTVTGALRGDELEAAFADLARRLPADLCRRLLDRLEPATLTMLAALEDVETVRAVLLRAEGHTAEILAAREPFLRPLGDALLVAWPDRAAAALLTPDDARDLCRTLLTEVDAGHRLITSPSDSSGTPVAAGLLAVLPMDASPTSLLAGPTGTALLVAALALVCGGGSFLAFRALRREAAALRVRTEFLTTVTHELKTPLAGVRLVAELLADDHVRGEDERRDWLRRLNGEAVRLGVLIENVLDLGRLDRGERPHVPAHADIGELVGETAALFTPLAERDGFEVRVDIPDRPTLAEVDRDALRQALVNVLDNARKYGASPLEVSVRNTGDWAEIAVLDHGPGIPAGERATVFERFQRGAAHGHGSTPGVGIGLHLARAIALRHGGSLTCDEPDGGGARFVFRLPRSEGGPR